jgi:hypothetical protein
VIQYGRPAPIFKKFLKSLPGVPIILPGGNTASVTTFPMPIRLLSFLNDIERALARESASNMGPAWEASRMVSYHQSLARMTLTPVKDSEPGTRSGSVFLQSFLLSDGSPCLKATLGWEGSTAAPVIAVYAKPELDWKSEATRIASAWLSGPVQANEAVVEAAAPAVSKLVAIS